MSLSMPSAPAPPSAPPPPPMFTGTQGASGKETTRRASNAGFGGTILGAATANTSAAPQQKTLLGQ